MADFKGFEKNQMKREIDSVDDFEHLGHDSSPLTDNGTADLLSGFKTGIEHTVRDVNTEIDKRAENVARTVTDMFDPLADVPAKMDSMGGHFRESSDHFDKFLDDFNPTQAKVGADKSSIQSFVDREREFLHDLPGKVKENVLDRYSDSEPEHDDFIDDSLSKKSFPETVSSAKTTDTFKDLDDFLQGAPKHEEPPKQKTPEPVFKPEPLKPVLPEHPKPEPIKSVPEPVKISEPVKQEPIKKQPIKAEEKTKIAPADTGAIFRKIGIGKFHNFLIASKNLYCSNLNGFIFCVTSCTFLYNNLTLL